MTDARAVAESIVEELEQDLEEVAARTFECYAERVRTQPTRGVGNPGPGIIPFRSGRLRDSIGLRDFGVVSDGVFQQEITVGARSADGFDYPTHLDLGSGLHSGWWEQANDQMILEECCDEQFS